MLGPWDSFGVLFIWGTFGGLFHLFGPSWTHVGPMFIYLFGTHLGMAVGDIGPAGRHLIHIPILEMMLLLGACVAAPLCAACGDMMFIIHPYNSGQPLQWRAMAAK